LMYMLWCTADYFYGESQSNALKRPLTGNSATNARISISY
jgi:hypothetical protein